MTLTVGHVKSVICALCDAVVSETVHIRPKLLGTVDQQK